MASTSMNDTVVTICVGSLFNSVFAIALIVVAVLLIIRIQKEAQAMEKTAAAIPAALKSLGFCEMPLDVVASLADNLKVPLEEVTKEYKDDLTKRQQVTENTFRNDEFNKKFTSASTFVARGYSESRNMKHS